MAELAAKRLDVGLEHVAPARDVVAPRVAKEIAAIDDRPLTLVEIAHHAEFQLRHVDPPAIEDELVLDDVEDRVVVDLEFGGDEVRPRRRT